MALLINERDHWQIPSGGELHSGDPIELYQDGNWISGRVDFRPRHGYVLRLSDGRELDVQESMQIRFQREGARLV